jgi:D-alanyl-D-alanine carboxypeptidase
VERAKNENPSFNQAQAEAYAATHVARPGTSEHQIGLAIDFNSVETDFGATAAGRWLKENANDYGFILRYEKDKQSLTGVTWEPWHYRFVGVKHAKRMTQLGYCLEEYVDYIRGGGQ